MGKVYADIELLNGDDIADVKRGRIGEDEITRFHVTMLVDTGSVMLAINEYILQALNISVTTRTRLELATGEADWFNVAGPIEVRFKNRRSSCNAVVLPGNSEPLLGAIPMEEMDLMVHPNSNMLIVNPIHEGY